MSNLITVDGGTTNTRIILWNGENICSAHKIAFGAKDNLKNPGYLNILLKDGISDIMNQWGILWEELSGILVSGMITSENGLCEIPHIEVPVGKRKLAEAIQERTFPDIAPIPLSFIPGVRTDWHSVGTDLSVLYDMDMMRGEETESVALIDKYEKELPLILVFPGSHNKFVAVNWNGEIQGCITSMTGEIFSALIKYTVLSGGTKNIFISIEELNEKALICGCQAAFDVGLGRAAFLARVGALVGKLNSSEDMSSYLMGVCLSQDLLAFRLSREISCQGKKIIISGNHIFARALVILFKKFYPEICVVQDVSENLSGIGARLIWEERKTPI